MWEKTPSFRSRSSSRLNTQSKGSDHHYLSHYYLPWLVETQTRQVETMTFGKQLIRRDPAAAALMGAMPRGSDFGHDFSADFGDFGQGAMGADFGDFGDAMGDDYGADSYSADFGARRAPHAPNPAAMARAYGQMQQRNARKKSRALLLDPNMDSELKVERYSFSVNITDPATGLPPVLGTSSSLSGTNTPDTHIKPSRIVLNVPSVALVLVNEIKVGNVAGTVGGIGDAFEYNSNGVGIGVTLPRMTPSTKASFLGAFTTFVPPGFVPGNSFPLVMTIKGASTLAPSA